MIKNSYYIGYFENSVFKPFLIKYIDITQVDLVTMSYTKEEFINYLNKYYHKHYHLNIENKDDLFILKITYNEKKDSYTFHAYNLLFKPLNWKMKYSLMLQDLLLERLLKVEKNDDSLRIDTSIKYDEFITYLIQNLFSDQNLFGYIVKHSNRFNAEILDCLERAKVSANFSNYFSLIKEKLANYRELRKILEAYLGFKGLLLPNNNYNLDLDNNCISSSLLGFPENYPLLIGTLNHEEELRKYAVKEMDNDKIYTSEATDFGELTSERTKKRK